MTDRKITFQLEVLKRHDAHITSANTKSGMILSFGAAALGVLIALMPNFWSLNNGLWYKSTLVIIALTIFIGLLSAIICSFLALFPNTTPGSRNSLISFVHTSSFDGGAEAYFQAVKSSTDDESLKDLCYQSHTLSVIAAGKFSNIKNAVNAVKVSFLSTLALVACLIIGSAVEINLKEKTSEVQQPNTKNQVSQNG
ncbi:MAG: Pycsar system effector family protein [Vibrio sp.]